MRAALATPDVTARFTAAARAAPFMAVARSVIAAGGDPLAARRLLEATGDERLAQVAKASVAPGRGDGSTWGSQLAELQPAASAFVELVRARTVQGRLTGYRRVPFGVKAPTQTSAASVGWTAEGAPVQASALGFGSVTLKQAKVGGIVTISKELAALSDPDAQALIENDLIAATAQFVDTAFLDPSLAAAGDAPASITNGAPQVTATGSDEVALKADIASLLEALEDAGSSLENVSLIMSARQATAIAAMPVGERLSMRGGELMGLPVEIAPAAAVRDAGSSPPTERIVAVDPTRIMLADAGVDLRASGEATVQMETAPHSPPTAATEMVNVWQHGLVAVMVTRYIKWVAAGGGAAAYLSGARYRA